MIGEEAWSDKFFKRRDDSPDFLEESLIGALERELNNFSVAGGDLGDGEEPEEHEEAGQRRRDEGDLERLAEQDDETDVESLPETK